MMNKTITIALLLLMNICHADYLVIKLGTRQIKEKSYTKMVKDWVDGQIINVLPDTDHISEHMKKHFVIMKVKKNYTKAEIASLLSPVGTESGGTQYKRRYYIQVSTVPYLLGTSVGQVSSFLSNLYKKDGSFSDIVDVGNLDIANIIQDHTIKPISTSTYDLGGSISSGAYTIGTGQQYATISAFEADLAATLLGSVTGQINVNYNDTTAVLFTGFNTTSANNVCLISTNTNVVHSGVWDGTRSSITVLISDGFSGALYANGADANHLLFNGLQIKVSAPNNSGARAFYSSGTKTVPPTYIFKNCIMYGGDSNMRFSNGLSTATITAYNCIFGSSTVVSTHGECLASLPNSSTATFVNCVFMGNKWGIVAPNNTTKLTLWNCYGATTTTGGYVYPAIINSTLISYNYSMSCDTTTSTVAYRNIRPQQIFTTYTQGQNNYTLNCTPLNGSSIIDAGFAPTGFANSVDIINKPRPAWSNYDIGVFEFQPNLARPKINTIGY